MKIYKYEGNLNIEPLTKVAVAKSNCNSKSASLKFLVLSDGNSEIEVYKLDASESKVNSVLIGTDVSQEGFERIGTINMCNEEGLQACVFEFRITNKDFVIALGSSRKFSILNPMLEESDGLMIHNEGPTLEDIIQAEILLNQTTILENQRAQDAVMAEILLGQLGV